MKPASVTSEGLILSALLVLEFRNRLSALLKNMVIDYRILLTLRSVSIDRHMMGFDRAFVDTQEIFSMSSP